MVTAASAKRPADPANGLFKTEVIHRRDLWPQLEDVGFATLEWVDWFSNRRRLEPIGDIPPVECEQGYYRSQETPTKGAGLR